MKNSLFRTTTFEVENVIKVWLRQSCDRAGGRQSVERGMKRIRKNLESQSRPTSAAASAAANAEDDNERFSL